MPEAHTYQIYIKEGQIETREYVCATDKYSAVTRLIAENSLFDMDRIQYSDWFEVERCT